MRGNKKWRQMRLSIKPGITGLWQVKARGEKDFENWVRYDLEYVRNNSFLLDLKILLLTIKAVITGKGAY